MWRHQIKLLTCLVLIRATVFTNHYCELLARALQALSNPYCLWTCLCVSVPVCVSVCPQLMMLNISKTKRGSCSIGSLWKYLRPVNWWRRRHHVTLWCRACDVTIFKVVAFGDYGTRINYPFGTFMHTLKEKNKRIRITNWRRRTPTEIRHFFMKKARRSES